MQRAALLMMIFLHVLHREKQFVYLTCTVTNKLHICFAVSCVWSNMYFVLSLSLSLRQECEVARFLLKREPVFF